MDPYSLIVVLLSPLPVMLAVAVYVWPQRAQPGPRLLLALMSVGSVMTVAYAGDIFGPTLTAKLFWLGLWYISATSVTPLLLLLAFWHVQLLHWLTPTRIAMTFAPIALLLLLYFTNDWHHQFYLSFGLETRGALPLRTSVRGPFYWVTMFTVFVYLLSTVYVLGCAWRRQAQPYRTQSAILLVATLAPLIAGVLHVFGINAFGYINLTSLSLIVTGLTYAWGISRHRIFDLVPVMHQAVFRHMPSGVVVVDARARIVEINPAACALFRVVRPEVIGRPFAMIFSAWPALPGSGPGAPPDQSYEVTVVIDGVPHDLLVTVAVLPEGKPALTMQRVVLLQDVTAFREAERKSHAQQRQLVILEERERMARDLHDGVGQVLGYVNAQVQAARTYLHSGQREIADAVMAQVTGVTQDAHADIRNFILGAPSGRTAPAELGAALTQFVARFAEQYGQPVTVMHTGPATAPWLTPAAQTQLLYVIQEALTNVRKHAQAASASVHCRVDDAAVEVTVADDGVGFDPETVTGEHFGLQIMQARMEEAGGSLAVASAPGRGALVTARLPRPAEAPAGADDLAGLRVLLADDQPLFRDGLHNLLAARGIVVVGAAANGAEAVKLAHDLQPDVVIMDIHMPVLDGLAAMAQIKQATPQIKVLMLTVAESDAPLMDALRRGASGYLLKNLDAQTLFTMLAQLRRGETVLTPSMATHLVRQFAGGETDAALTARQRELLSLMAQGFTYREIAAQVHLSESAVKYNAGQIIDRLHARTRAEAVRIAEKRGLI